MEVVHLVVFFMVEKTRVKSADSLFENLLNENFFLPDLVIQVSLKKHIRRQKCLQK